MIPETEQWLLEGNCDKCRKEKYCDKDCSAYKKAVTKAMKEAYKRIMEKAQDKWNEEHPYMDQNGVRYATEQEAKEADERIDKIKNEKKIKEENIDEPCDACTIPANTRTDNNVIKENEDGKNSKI